MEPSISKAPLEKKMIFRKQLLKANCVVIFSNLLKGGPKTEGITLLENPK